MMVRVFVLILLLPGLASAADPGPLEPSDPRREESAEFPPGEPPSMPRVLPSRQQQLRELDRRLNVLESLMVGRGHRRGVLERGLGWSAEVTDRGFAMFSSDGSFRLHLNGGVQAQYNAFPRGQSGHDPGTEPDGFEFRRVRPILDFRIGRFVRGQIMPDLAPRRRTELYNAFLDFDALEWARLRVGQFKPALSLEKLQGEFDLVFAERSLVQNFVPFRDFGVQLTGVIFKRHVRYDLGVFNGSPQAIGPANFAAPSTDNNKHGLARLMATPFLLNGPPIFRQLQVGVGVMAGTFQNTAGQQPMLTMGQERTIFQYQNSVLGNGVDSRIVPQMMWFWKRWSVTSLFVHTWEPKHDVLSGRAATLQHEAWVVQGEFLLTDDQASYTRVNPRRPFDLSKPGAWGAWELAARYSEQHLDPETFGLQFGDASQFARTTKAFSVALNWYANREFRLQWVWEHSDFKGSSPAYVAAGTSDIVITRFTLLY